MHDTPMTGDSRSTRSNAAATVGLLVTVLLYPGGWWPALVIASALALYLLLRPELQRSASLWWLMFILLTVGYLRGWWITDNHHLVIIVAVLLWATTTNPGDRERREEGSRLLIGAVFLVALLAKFSTGDFLNGDFGRVWPTYDYRLAGVVERLGAITNDQVTENGALVDGLSTHPNPTEALSSFHLAPSWFVYLFTLWTLVIESAIAFCYLLGHRQRLLTIGHIALLLFCATTYTIVPVQGFAAILLALSISAASGTRWSSVLPAAFACVILLPITAHLV